ncbi:sulfite exporter TauE/SafE family protein [bacterium]|nr:sulfite exporter TauE/SafE family protein [bacterium]
MEITQIVILILFGVIGGYLSGLLGVGGGIIFIPIISYFLEDAGLGEEEYVRYLLANSFATIFFAGLVSTWKQYRMKSFYPKQILYTAATAMVSSAIMTWLIARVDWYNQKAFYILFLALLVFTVFRFIKKTSQDFIEVKDTQPKKYLITGFLTGLVTALSGLGGGIVMIPLFSQYIKLDMKSSSAISIGVIPLILVPILYTYLSSTPTTTFGPGQLGYIIPGMFFPMVAGLVFAAPLGVATAQKISNKLLQIIFAVLVIIVIINTIFNLV